MKYKITYSDGTVRIVDTNSVNKVVKAKDCDTAMKAVEDACVKDAGDFFTVSYVNNGVNQIIAVRASSEQEAKQKFTDYMKKKGRQVEFVGVTRGKEDKPGMPVIDTRVKDVRELYEVDGVRIYEDTRTGTVELNFSASGTVSIQKAENLIKNIQSAIDRAKTIENEYKTGKRKKE